MEEMEAAVRGEGRKRVREARDAKRSQGGTDAERSRGEGRRCEEVGLCNLWMVLGAGSEAEELKGK